MAAGTGGWHPGSPARFDARLWAREARTARAVAASTVRPLPLLRPDHAVVVGATIRTVGQPARRVAAIPYERLRSHQVVIGSTGTGKTTLVGALTAQSWEGLGTDDDERYRVAATAEGGIWLLRTPRPEPVTELAGTRTAVQTTRYLSGRHTRQSSGISTQREIPVVDPGIIRRLDVGQAAYLYRAGVTYLHVKPPAAAAEGRPAIQPLPVLIRPRVTPAL
jgi:hypothetical protein